MNLSNRCADNRQILLIMELVFHKERNILQPFPVADALMCLSCMPKQAVFPLCST